MSEYKRLTNNNLEKYDPEYDFCVGCKYFGEPNGCNRPNGTCDNYERFLETYNCLTGLEDKIENGTLIELPCKVGDTIYEVFKYHKLPFIQQTKVEKIIVTEKGLKLKLARNSSYETSISSLGKTLFLTEESAKAQIKKLQEKQKMKNNSSDAHA